MYRYNIKDYLAQLSGEPEGSSRQLVLLSSEELDRATERANGVNLGHTPSARDARTCKAEIRGEGLCGTIATPRHTREKEPIAFGFLLTQTQAVICDDSGVALTLVQRIIREKLPMKGDPAIFFCALLEQLLVKDMHHLQEIEDSLEYLEDRILGGQEGLNQRLTAIRKEVSGWIRYYTQLEDMICEIQDLSNFSEEEGRLLHQAEKRVGRLKNEAQMLREQCLQLRELFQAEIDIRQNRIMKALTIVTTIFLPLSLVAAWYGMNFKYMPELSWKYGYPAVIVASALVVLICLWIMKKKKFW